MASRSRIFFGWFIVVVVIICMTLIYGVRNSFSILFGPILDEFGWLRADTSIMLSLNILFYGLFAPVAGSLVDRWKPRYVVFIGIAVFTIATALCYFASELWHFYLLFGFIVPLGTAFVGSPVLNPTIINWFSKARGLAISMGQLGGGLSFAYTLVIERVVNAFGDWRPAFLVMAATIVVIVLPLYFFFYWFRPEDRGMKAYGTEEAEPAAKIAAETKPAAPQADWTLKTAFRTRSLWGLILSQFFFWGIGNYLIIAHQVKFATEAGYSTVMATSVFALFGLISMGGQVVASISDKIGRERTALIGVVLAIAAIIALLQVRDSTTAWLLYVYSICSGLATGIFTPQVFAGMGDIFHGKNIGVISSLLLTGLGIGGLIGPWLGGRIYDLTGSYTGAFYVVIGAYVAAAVSFLIAAPRKAEELRAGMQSKL